MFDGPLFSRSTFGAEKQLISCRFGKRSTCNQTVTSGRIKAGFVDFVVFSLEIDRVRCVPERSFLVRNWCGPPYQLAGPRVIDHANRTVGSNPTLSAKLA